MTARKGASNLAQSKVGGPTWRVFLGLLQLAAAFGRQTELDGLP
jgi:hypothetical protein